MDVGACAHLHVLVVDDEINIRKTLGMYLESEGCQVTAVSNAEDAAREVREQAFDLAFVDLRLGITDGLDLIPALLKDSPWLKIIVITAYASIETAIEAMRRGATDYLPKPFTPAQIGISIGKMMEIRSLEERIEALARDLGRSHPDVDFSTEDPGMQRVLYLARQVARSDATVLFTGESGTGKTELARYIHQLSPRAGVPFGVVSCPSLSTELLDSELFGHVRGAFTGAIRDNRGKIAACEGGTLLLDEIGDLPVMLQPKLLRFIQEREYERVGDSATHRANVRILAATNIDLGEAVKKGLFREELLYRINVVEIEVPPLRERRADIRPLAERLLAFFSPNSHRRLLGFTDEAWEFLLRYEWPGNVRELRNAIERAVILCKTDRVGIEYLPEKIKPAVSVPKAGDPLSLARIEEEHIRRVLANSRSLQEAAEILGIDQATLWRRRKQYNM